MRKTDYLSLCAVILAGMGCSSALITACGGDDSGTEPTGDAGADSGGGEDATSTPFDGTTPTPEATTSDDSGQQSTGDDDSGQQGVDSGHRDAGVDSGSPDTGVDSSEPDTGVDSGAPDTGAPDTGVDSGEPDTGVDSGEPDTGVDSGEPDAETDGGEDSGPVDAGVTDAADAAAIGFSNPVQVDVSSILNANSVVTTASGGLVLTPMDGTDSTERNNFPTQTEVQSLNDAGAGLPDFASFAGDGVSIPPVQLSWTNASNVPNSLVVEGNAGTTYTFNVPQAKYSQVQIYATGGSGGSSLDVKFTYAGGATGTATMSIPDWCSTGILSAGEYKLVSVDRVQAGQFYIAGLCNIYAINLGPDSSQVLTQVSFSDNGTSGEYLVFYGATAW